MAHRASVAGMPARDPTSGVEAKQFRDAMCRLGAAVHIITTEGRHGRAGFTATAVCSVSDAPPILLVCVNRTAVSMPVLRANGAFCVNTLRAGDEPVADTFAGRTQVAREQRFHAGHWLTLASGSPVLQSAIVAFDCRTIEIRTVASHDVYFGLVQAIHSGTTGRALVYHDRVYKHV